MNKQLTASVETIVGTAMPAERAASPRRDFIPSTAPRSRWVFSIVTVQIVDQEADRERHAAEGHRC